MEEVFTEFVRLLGVWYVEENYIENYMTLNFKKIHKPQYKIEYFLLQHLIGICTLIAVHYYCFFYLQFARFSLIPTLVSITPALFFYFIFSFFIPPLGSSVFISSLTILLSIGNNIKYFTTFEPMSWYDLVNVGNNFSIIKKYITSTHIVFIVTGLIIFFIILKFFKIYKPRKIMFFIQSSLVLVFGFMALHPYLGKLGHKDFSKKIEDLQASFNIYYQPGEWPKNVQRNGLFIHLIQTSTRRVPIKNYNETEIAQYFEYSGSKLEHKPKNIIYILCESCWYDENNFSDVFKPLEENGFIPFRAVAPVYGGGTPNSTFEILTGLPAKTKYLDGIIYQEYANLFKKNINTLVNSVKNEGYKTYSLHNGIRNYWKRDLVEPKFGFEQYIGMEQMLMFYKISLEGDTPLFNQAKNTIQKDKNEKFFLHLINISTHGPYKVENDDGEKEYSKKATQFVKDLIDFVDEFEKNSEDFLIVIYSDHKPYFENYYTKNKVFNKEDPWEIMGDVPVWIKSGNSKINLKEFVAQNTQKPLYCLAAAINETFIGVNVPGYNFNNLEVCPKYFESGYTASALKTPEALYSSTLFY